MNTKREVAVHKIAHTLFWPFLRKILIHLKALLENHTKFSSAMIHDIRV